VNKGSIPFLLIFPKFRSLEVLLEFYIYSNYIEISLKTSYFIKISVKLGFGAPFSTEIGTGAESAAIIE